MKITDHCHLHSYTCTTSEIVCSNCCWDIRRKIYFRVLHQGQGQRLRSHITVISRYIYQVWNYWPKPFLRYWENERFSCALWTMLCCPMVCTISKMIYPVCYNYAIRKTVIDQNRRNKKKIKKSQNDRQWSHSKNH